MFAERKKSFSRWEATDFPGKRKKEIKIMSAKNNNQLNVPQAREAMDKFKMQAASEEDVLTTS